MVRRVRGGIKRCFPTMISGVKRQKMPAIIVTTQMLLIRIRIASQSLAVVPYIVIFPLALLVCNVAKQPMQTIIRFKILNKFAFIFKFLCVIFYRIIQLQLLPHALVS